METCDPAARSYLQSCLYAARAAINNGTVDEPRRQKYWKDWCEFTRCWNVSPFLDEVSRSRQADILTAFAVGVREGHYGRGNRITAQSVDRAIRAVGQTFQLACRPDPTKIDGGHQRILPLGRQIATYRREDPPPKPQLAIPVTVIEHMQTRAASLGHATKDGAVVDLCTIAFFFLLRVGEYTMPAANRRTRTVQFRVQDVKFYKNGFIVPNNSPLHVLVQSDGVALCIDNQKNGTRGETIFQHALPGRSICPVCALARRVSAVMQSTHDASYPISLIGNGNNGHITSSHVRVCVRASVTALKLFRQGIKSSDVGAHSLRAGGAMSMKLNGCDLISIMKAGRWTSLTFLTYIHNQVAHLGANITHRMATRVPFFSF